MHLKLLNRSGHKPNKICVDSEFYNGSIKLWLHGNENEMYLTHNEGKLVVVFGFACILMHSRAEWVLV